MFIFAVLSLFICLLMNRARKTYFMESIIIYKFLMLFPIQIKIIEILLDFFILHFFLIALKILILRMIIESKFQIGSVFLKG